MHSPYDYGSFSFAGAAEHPSCDSCGQKVEQLFDCYWDAQLKVGVCCLIHSDETEAYSEPLCERTKALAISARSVQEFAAALQHHVEHCAACNPLRKPVASQAGSGQAEKGIA